MPFFLLRQNAGIFYVTNVVKYPSGTKWEGKIASVKVVRYGLLEIYCALAEVSESVMDSKSAAEVSGIEKAIISFEFILSTVIWYEVFSKADPVRKNLQLSNININIAMSQMSSLIAFMNKFRKFGFAKCLDSA